MNDDWKDIALAAAPMTPEQRREQTANFAFGQMACMREYANASAAELDNLRAVCRILAGCEGEQKREPLREMFRDVGGFK
jgi:hypothetical protein